MCAYNVADGNIRVWKDYNLKNKQKRVTAFSSIQGHKPGVQSLNAVVDWQQQSGYLVHIFLKNLLFLDLLILMFWAYILRLSVDKKISKFYH